MNNNASNKINNNMNNNMNKNVSNNMNNNLNDNMNNNNLINYMDNKKENNPMYHINNIDNNNGKKSGVNDINKSVNNNKLKINSDKKKIGIDEESNHSIIPINDNIPTPALIKIGENEIDFTCPPSASSKSIIQIIPSYYIDIILQCFLNIKKVNDFFSNLSQEQINKNNSNLIQLIYMIVQKMKSEGNNDDIGYYLERINKFLNLKEKSCTFKNVLLLILNNIYNDILGQNGKMPKSEIIDKNKSEAYNHFIKKISHNRFFDLFYGIKKIEYYCAYCYTKYYRYDLFKIISINVEEKKNSNNKNAQLKNSFVEYGVNENQNNNWMNEPGPYFDFLNNLYDKILKEQKNQKKFKCICGSTHFFKGKNIYNICPEILFISFDININEQNSFYVKFVLNLNMNDYIENKSSDADYKYELNSFITYDLKLEEYITYFKYNNKFIKMTKENTNLIDIDSFDVIKNPVLLFYEKI
jgi:hypothetical protein